MKEFDFIIIGAGVISLSTALYLSKSNKRIAIIEKDLNETQLDFFYLSSPENLSIKLENLDLVNYAPVDFSRIYLSYNDFINFKNKISILETNNEKNIQKK